MNKVNQTLEGVSETLLMTLYARARASQRPDPMIRDDRAIALINQIECDFSRLRMQRHDEIAVIMRMNRFDRYARDFLAREPRAVIVHIGCGLDTRFERVDNGQVEWFDLDLPEVIELRGALMSAACSRCHVLAASVFDDGWFSDIEPYKPRSFMFLAEGVFPYFEEAVIKALFLKLCDHFPGCEMVCDAHTPFVIWADNLQLAHAGVNARLHWRLKHGKDVESWGKGIRMLDEWNYYQDDDPHLRAFRWVRMIPPLAKSSGIFHYRLG